LFAGDLLGINVVRAWELNSTFPLRSIVPVYIGTALPLLLLRAMSTLCGSVISWYSLTVAVRLMVTVLTLITDYAVMQLARWLSKDAVSAAVVMATSYISIIYYTRTFSNTLESFLYAALLCIVIRRSHQQRADISSAIIVSSLIVVGVFNRPTFIMYAAVPYLWWLYSDAVYGVVVKATHSALSAVPVCLLLIVCDSVYFGWIDIGRLNIADLSDILTFVTCNLTVTPINFIWYNTQADNLAEHGIHPRFTHFAVNFPLLFTVLSLGFFSDVFRWCRMSVARCTAGKQSSVSRQRLLLICCIIPTGLLSLFPHQEPRFLIPLLPVLAALYADEVTASRFTTALWIITNVCGCLFYGSVHQGGVLPCLGHLQQTHSYTVDRHVVFWHTYTAPQHLLVLPQLKPGHTRTSTSVTSLEGNSVEDFIRHLTLINSTESSRRPEKPEVMVAMPSSHHHDLVCKTADAGIRLDQYQSFWPHLSTEHPPRIDDILCHVSVGNCHTDADNNDSDFCNKSLIERIQFLTSLSLYRVTFL